MTARPGLVVGITGATGTIFGVRILQLLHEAKVDTHLVMSNWGARTLVHETPYSVSQVQQMASHVYPVTDQGAAISSGSVLTTGMVIAPCSMKTLASIACGVAQNLVHRAADVILKERRKLVLVVREAPLSDIHLDATRTKAPGDSHALLPEGMTLEQWEDEMIREALRRANGNKSQAARLLGLSRNALRYRLSKIGIADEPEPQA